ncbi:carbohydrate porin [Pendulispora brunnea]|uniref:Carbohydrate porin n=1 Tax=Pendulispora brunnea TaxID=2905690 RepID=A0ABZ2K9D1_9BACT
MMLLGRSIPSFGAGSSRCTSPRARRRAVKACLAGFAALAGLGLVAPKTASADITSDRIEFFQYGRMGIGWTKSGQVIQGQTMNLAGGGQGGRLEEGDYIQPGVRFHLKKGESATDTTVDVVNDYEIFSNGAGILSDLANGEVGKLSILPQQFYVQAKNIFTPGLEIWLGSRLYRKNDIHIADYFYFNRLNGQGVGAIYTHPKFGEIDVAILEQTGSTNFFRLDAGQVGGTPGTYPFGYRARTMFIAQYKYPLPMRTSFIQALGEFHVVPRSQAQDNGTPANVNPPDWGAVGGLKLHLDFGGDSFSDTSIRYGSRLANGAQSGGATYNTFGNPAENGTYKGAYGVEAIEHFVWDIDKIAGINGYFLLNYSTGSRSDGLDASNAAHNANERLNYAFGIRPIIYVRDDFHLVTEATYQARKDENLAMGSAVKLSVVPTIVPAGGRSVWSRPHLRAIYTLGIYNQAAQDQLMSPFLRTVGETKLAHYVGVRAEWWF